VVALWRGLSGWWLRGLALLVLLAIANPSIQQEDRAPLTDIVLMVVDRKRKPAHSPGGPAQTGRGGRRRSTAEIEGLDNTELRTIVTLRDADENDAARELMRDAGRVAMAEAPRARIAGGFLVTDGQLHDIERAPDLPAPLHTLLTGAPEDWDRRLVVTNAPAFAILGEPVTLTLRIEDEGAVPAGLGGRAALSIAVDGGEPRSTRCRWARISSCRSRCPWRHERDPVHRARGRGRTDRPQQHRAGADQRRARPAAVAACLGRAASGGRTWRNLLKSDSSVDLVHFTILRPPEKQDGVPVRTVADRLPDARAVS
jgi:hypothetical protein